MKLVTIALVWLQLATSVAFAEQWSGNVIAVTDGDTLKVLNRDKETIKIRLNEIDAPEHSQAFGNASKQSLSDLAFGKEVVVVSTGKDKYGRTLGRVFVGEVDVSTEQIRRGMAWVFRRYSNNAALISLEAQAQKAKAGLWKDDDPTPPWDYRRALKGQPPVPVTTAPVAGPPGAAGDTACGSKTYCKQMTTCEEAMHFFKGCGLSRLDSDGDGVPCEALCQ